LIGHKSENLRDRMIWSCCKTRGSVERGCDGKRTVPRVNLDPACRARLGHMTTTLRFEIDKKWLDNQSIKAAEACGVLLKL
jgi:hypothetical protein